MERLIFTNANGQQVEFSNFSAYKWTQVEGLGEGSVTLQTTTSPYQDGSTNVGGAYFNSKVVKVDLVISGTDVSADLRTLNAVLNPKLGLGTLSYERDSGIKMLNKVRTRSLPSLPGGASRGVSFQNTYVIFEVFDPLYEDQNATEASVNTGGNLFSFPLNIGDDFIFDYTNTSGVIVQNLGDAECPLTIILDGPKSSPLEIENVTTGEKIVLSTSIAAGERLTITTAIDNTNVIKTNLSTGASTVAFQYLDVSQTTFFMLALGQNRIKISAAEAEVEEAIVRFKNRYVGV